MILAETAFARIVGATMSGTFLTALIVTLGGAEGRIGFGAAAVHIGAVGMLMANPIINYIGSRRIYSLICLGVVRSLRLLIAALPLMVFLGMGRESFYYPLMACVVVSMFFGMSAEVARRSWISDLVGAEYRGRFFGRRTRIVALTNAGVLLVGGALLAWSKSDAFPLRGDGVALMLAILLGAGGAAGWIGWSLLYRAPDPPISRPRRRTGFIRSLKIPWRRPRFRPLMIVATAQFFAAGVCGIMFFDYYMLRYLGMNWMLIAMVNVVGFLATGASANFFGAWADRAGAKRVLIVAMVGKAAYPIIWIFATPGNWPIVFVFVLVRVFNSAMLVSLLRLSLDLSPARNRAAYLAMYQATAGTGMAVGAMIGGALAAYLRQFDMVVLGFTVVPLHVLFVLSTVLRMACLPLARFIHEPQRAS